LNRRHKLSADKYERHLQHLAEFAEKEDREYKFAEHEFDLPVLHNYIRYTQLMDNLLALILA
jgi:hypothetical protein